MGIFVRLCLKIKCNKKAGNVNSVVEVMSRVIEAIGFSHGIGGGGWRERERKKNGAGVGGWRRE